MKKPRPKAAGNIVQHEIVPLKLSKLRPHPKNPNIHPDSQKVGLGKSMRRYGFTSVPVVDEHDLILAGHARVEQAIAGGLTSVDGIVVRGWSEKKKLEFMIADNQQGKLSRFDDDVLRDILLSLQGSDADFGAMGFDDAALAAALAKPNSGQTDPDDAPPKREKPAVRLGDVWILGAHRLICGDATKKETHDRLLAGAKPNLMVTDPPYGVNYDPAWRAKAGVGSKGAAKGKVMNDDRANWEEVWSLFKGHVAYVWHGGLHGSVVQASLDVAGFKLKAQIIWNKSRAALGRGNYHWKHEPAFYVGKPGKPDDFQFSEEHEVAAYVVADGSPHSWTGGRKQSTVWDIDHIKNDTGHGTQKPVECMRRLPAEFDLDLLASLPSWHPQHLGDGLDLGFRGCWVGWGGFLAAGCLCRGLRGPFGSDRALGRFNGLGGGLGFGRFLHLVHPSLVVVVVLLPLSAGLHFPRSDLLAHGLSSN